MDPFKFQKRKKKEESHELSDKSHEQRFSVNFQHISQNATLATEFARCRHFTALTMRCAKNTQHDSSKVLRLPAK